MHNLKFLLDADMPRSSAELIRSIGYEVEDVRDIGMRAAKDREIIEYALKNNRIIITRDTDFGEVLRYPEHPGAIILRLPYAPTSKDINERKKAENNRRFIEESFPVKEVSIESAKEKSIRHGHISTLHIWWARRPLASSRATNYAALIPAPDNVDEWNKTRQFIIDFSKWENSLNPTLIEKAREDILKANGGKPPKVLDPFGGGGAIPLEALRLGCETYSNDLNPVAVLIQKCTLEYPQKYGRQREKGENGKIQKTRYLRMSKNGENGFWKKQEKR